MTKALVAIALLSALTFSARRAMAGDAAPELKDRDTAFVLSAGGTAVSIGLFAAGVRTDSLALLSAGALGSLVAPAAGEFYAGKLLTPGLGIRLLSVVVAVVGAVPATTCEGSGAGGCGDGATALFVVGAVGYASGMLYDIATAGSAVDAYNQRLRLRVTATVIPTASSGPAVGVGVGGSF